MSYKKFLANELSTYFFDKVWNEPTSEFMINIKTANMSMGRTHLGSYHVHNSILEFPTYKKHFYVHRLNSHDIPMLFPENTWVTGKELCNDHDLLIHTYSTSGKVVPKSEVYFFKYSNSNIVTMLLTSSIIKDMGIENEDIYVTFSKDSTIGTEVTIYDKLDTELDLKLLVSGYLNKHQLICFYNGQYIEYKDITDLPIDETFNVIIDKNIIAETKIKITDNSYSYIGKDGVEREILHIPKVINPNNIIYTPNTLDIYICDKTTKKGLYVHNTPIQGIKSITHNDISIPSRIVEAYKDDLRCTNVFAMLKIRNYDKDNYLVPSGSFLEVMYKEESDDKIIQHLLGNIDPTLSFWKASELEDSLYIRSMVDHTTVTEDNIDEYINTLGYTNTISMLANNNVNLVVSENTPDKLSFKKPAIWYGKHIKPLLYINGLKVLDKYVKYINTAGILSISLHNLVTKIGDKIGIIFLPTGNNDYHSFIPTELKPSISIEADHEIVIYEKVSLNDKIKSMYKEHYSSFREIDDSSSNVIVLKNDKTNTYVITFGKQLYNKEFFIGYKEYNHYKELNIDEYLNQNKSISIPLLSPFKDHEIPIIVSNQVIVHLNRKYLIEDIDYKLTRLKDPDGNVVCNYITIQNLKHLLKSGNVIEIHCLGTDDVSKGFDYLVDDIYIKEDESVIDGITNVFINGNYDNDFVSDGRLLKFETDKYPNGSVAECITKVPIWVTKTLEPNNINIDKDRLTKINNYLKYKETTIDQIILPESYGVISSYFHFLMIGILNDTIRISYDPIQSNMLKQLEPYEYLKQFDLIFSSSVLDLDFVDIWPSYNNTLLGSDKKKTLLKYLFRIIFTEDNISSGVTLNV